MKKNTSERILMLALIFAAAILTACQPQEPLFPPQCNEGDLWVQASTNAENICRDGEWTQKATDTEEFTVIGLWIKCYVAYTGKNIKTQGYYEVDISKSENINCFQKTQSDLENVVPYREVNTSYYRVGPDGKFYISENEFEFFQIGKTYTCVKNESFFEKGLTELCKVKE